MFSPDGSRVVTAARDGTARIWNAASGEQLFVLHQPGEFHTALFSPDGTRVLTAVGRRVIQRSGMRKPETKIATVHGPCDIDLLPLVPTVEASRRPRACEQHRSYLERGRWQADQEHGTFRLGLTGRIQPGRKPAPDQCHGTQFHVADLAPLGCAERNRDCYSSRSQERHARRHVQSRRPPCCDRLRRGPARLWDGVYGRVASTCLARSPVG